MKVLLGYPSELQGDGYLQVGQNRQSFRFSVGKTAAIFPCLMAYAATMLKQAGDEVIWADGPSEGMAWPEYLSRILEAEPELILWEAKTPSIMNAWAAAGAVKEFLPETTIALCGDHVTALPTESLEKPGVDLVLQGGDWDFAVADLVSTGILTQKKGIVATGTNTNLSRLPTIDRQLCRWRNYDAMGNYLYLPGTHGYSARDCWWRKEGGCTFCSWTGLYKNYRTISVDQFMADVASAHALGAREYFDDAGTWAPPGRWFEDATHRLRVFNAERPFYRALVAMGCNDRPGARGADEYRSMAASGFRFILYGLESANYATLERINKGQAREDMLNAAKWASQAGLQPHITTMCGYPWETKADAQRTVDFVQELFRKGYVNTIQATILMPYPGTALFKQAEERGWLKYGTDWREYDMRKPVLHCPMTDKEVLQMTRSLYRSCMTPRFVVRKLCTMRSRDDVRFLVRGLRYALGHLADFRVH